MSNLRPIQVSSDVLNRLFRCLTTRYKVLHDQAVAHLYSFEDEGTYYRLNSDQRAATRERLGAIKDGFTTAGGRNVDIDADTGYPKFVHRVPNRADVVPAFPTGTPLADGEDGDQVDYRSVMDIYLRAWGGDATARWMLERLAWARGGKDEPEFGYEVSVARERLANVLAFKCTDRSSSEDENSPAQPSAACVERAIVLYGLSQSFNATEALEEFATIRNVDCFGYLGIGERRRHAALATHFLLRDAIMDSPHVCHSAARVLAAGVDGVVERDSLIATLLLCEGVKMRDDNCVIELEKLCNDLANDRVEVKNKNDGDSGDSKDKEQKANGSERCERLTLLRMSEQAVARNITDDWKEGASGLRSIREKLSMVIDQTA